MRKIDLRSIAITAAVLAVTAISPAAVVAGAIVHNGATFEVTATVVDANTAAFQYTADFTDPGWLASGGLDYIFAIDFKLENYEVDNIDLFSTNATGGWAATTGNTNANGCSTSLNSSFVCAWDDPFDESSAALAQGILTWDFTVSFTEDVDPDDFLNTNNHIGAFFKRCDYTAKPNDGDARKCKPGVGLSGNESFGPPDPDPDPMPVPGTLLLLGLGLGFLARARRAC